MAIWPLGGVEKTSEDCLYLNVWTSGTAGNKRPVMFWCYGGGFFTGSGSSPWTDGGNLCRLDDVVVVSFNHRLGALGYLHLEDIAGSDFAGAGTAGVRDIVVALDWVRDNIANSAAMRATSRSSASRAAARRWRLMALPRRRGCSTRPSSRAGRRYRWPRAR